MISRRAALALGALLAGSALAQPAVRWPGARPITLIVPFAAGSDADATARLLAHKLAERLKQSVVVDNVAGAGGAIGVARVAAAAPDGYTLVLGADGPVLIARLVNPAAVTYDALKELAPIGLVGTVPLVLVARPGLAAGNLAELIRLARARPGELSYATAGTGSVAFLAMELIKERGRASITHVPYRGDAQIVVDVVGNQVDLALLASELAAPQLQAKKMKALAVTDDKRLAALPEVPIVAETPGFHGYDMVAWSGLFAPAGTPEPVLERLNHALNEVLRLDDVQARLAQQGALAGSGSAADFGQFVRREQERYGRIVKAANLRE